MTYKQLRFVYSMYVKYATYLKKIKDMKMTPKKWLIAGVVLFVVYLAYNDKPPKSINSANVSTEYNDMINIAQFYADNVLPQNLKHPDGWEYERKQMDRLDSITYKFTAVVLAKNGFGVRGRLMYNFKIQYVGTKENSYSSDMNKLPGNWKILTSEVVQ